jgi:hypothetical protein
MDLEALSRLMEQILPSPDSFGEQAGIKVLWQMRRFRVPNCSLA